MIRNGLHLQWDSAGKTKGFWDKMTKIGFCTIIFLLFLSKKSREKCLRENLLFFGDTV